MARIPKPLGVADFANHVHTHIMASHSFKGGDGATYKKRLEVKIWWSETGNPFHHVQYDIFRSDKPDQSSGTTSYPLALEMFNEI